jgi:PAS domain S-box-containing protein
MKLTIPQKALVLVAIPLLSSIICTVSMGWFLHTVEEERRKDELARDITTHLTTLVGLAFRQCSLSTLLFLQGETPRTDNSLTPRVAAEMQALKALDAIQPLKPGRLSKIFEFCQTFQQGYEQTLATVQSGDRVGALSNWVKLQRALNSLNVLTEELLADQEAIIAERQANEERLRKNMQSFMIFAFIGNILIAWLLLRYFKGEVIKPLGIVADNTLKIAVGQNLVQLPDASGEVAQLNEVFLSMADEIASTRQRERAVLDDAVDVICSIDDGGRVLEINNAVRSLLQYAPEEVLGLRVQQLVLGDDAAKTASTLSRLVEQGESAGFECRLVQKGGAIRHTDWTVRGSSREKTLFCIVRDITRLKEIEQLKKDFVAMVSHDLRTPLTSIQMFHSLLESGACGELSEDGLARVATAEHNVELLLGLVNDLLELERMESGQFLITTGAVDVVRIFDDVYDSTIGFCDRHKVKLVTSLPEPFPQINGDAGRITQVLINLVSNAVKFSQPGQDVRVVAEPGDTLATFRVQDNGRGIPPELQATVFERFKQVSADDSRVKQGAGLGLAICKAIVERHGGRIGVTSEVGRGSDFWFTVPLFDEALSSQQNVVSKG